MQGAGERERVRGGCVGCESLGERGYVQRVEEEGEVRIEHGVPAMFEVLLYPLATTTAAGENETKRHPIRSAARVVTQNTKIRTWVNALEVKTRIMIMLVPIHARSVLVLCKMAKQKHHASAIHKNKKRHARGANAPNFGRNPVS